jgi:hypothetical protein
VRGATDRLKAELQTPNLIAVLAVARCARFQDMQGFLMQGFLIASAFLSFIFGIYVEI